jgi:hypothetical protein
MNHLLWEIPLAVFLILGFFGILIAPYQLYKEGEKANDDLEGENKRLRNSLQDIGGPELFLGVGITTGVLKHGQLLVNNLKGGTAYRVQVQSITFNKFTANFDEIPVIKEGDREYCQSKDNTANTLGPLIKAIEESLASSVDMLQSVRFPVFVSCQDSSARTFIHDFECECWPFASTLDFKWKGRKAIASQVSRS